MSELRNTKLDDHIPGTSTTRYTLRSPALKFIGSTLLYNDGKQEHLFDFSELYLPATSAHPFVTRLSDYPQHVDTLIAAADLRIDRSKESLPPARSLSRQLYLIRHVLDWLRARGIYRLGDATEDNTRELLAQLAKGGWADALSLEWRWTTVLDRIETEEIDLTNAFHFRHSGGTVLLETLMQPFWRKQLGWGGIAPITAAAKARLQKLAANWPVSKNWANRGVSASEAPSRYVLRNIMGWLNDLAALPASVDRLERRVTNSANSSAKKMAQKPSSRTANLQVDDAVKVISTALKLLYEIAPLLLKLYKNARIDYFFDSKNKRQEWLYTSAARERLENALDKKITNWTWSGHHPRKPTCYSVDEILAAVQGACAIVLASMNARRQREICDPHRGVRIGDHVVLDESLGLNQCWFYIEKTYRDRHLFYVNQASADALRCLDRLKSACTPFDSDITETPSLFECGRFTENGASHGSHFSFAEDSGRTRSLISFLKFTYKDSEMVPDLATHMFRRFYAILYYHRYEHAELRALKQHLRHLDIAMTRVYVTDPSTRPLAEQIATALRKRDDGSVNVALTDSLESDALDIQNAIEEMGKEKLRMAVEEIISGTPTAGGFSKIVRKLYRQMLPRVVVQGKVTEEVANQIMSLFDAHGYHVKPMQHGQCHAPAIRRNLKGACEQDGTLAQEHANPRVCGNCPFHFNNISYVQNLREQLSALASDIEDFMLSPQQQARAQFEHQNLNKLIILTERQMAFNASTITEISGGEPVSRA